MRRREIHDTSLHKLGILAVILELPNFTREDSLGKFLQRVRLAGPSLGVLHFGSETG